MAGMALTLLVILTVSGLAVNLNLHRRRPHGTLHALDLSLLKAFTAGILTDRRIGASHPDISSAAVHGVVVDTILCRTY